MIVKGAARGGPRQLAIYLMRVERYDTGEEAKLLELRSPWADGANGSRERCAAKLIEAFRDWQDLAEGTEQGRDGLYRAEISPAPEYAKTMTDEQALHAADILEEELGFQGQDRAVVRHAGKDGRVHFHVVWQRTDLDTMKIIPDSFNYVAHERASMRMEKEFGQDFVPGKHAKRDRKMQQEFPRQDYDYAEAQMAQRSGMTPAEREEQITALKQAAANGQELKKGLEDAGYILAKGDRGYLVVDEAGVHSALSRNIQGMKKAQVEAFMADVPLAQLPTVEEAQAQQKAKALQAQPPAPAEEQAKHAELTEAERKEQITALRKQSDTAQAFKNAIEEAGYLLAHGPRNGFYIIDQQGETFNLSRLSGISGKEYKAFMDSVNPAALPSVDEAKALQETRDQARQAAAKVEPPAEAQKQTPEPSKFLSPELVQKIEQPTPAPPQPEKQPIPQEPASKFLPPATPAAPSEAPVPPSAEQKPPAEDPELIALKKAVAQRQAEDAQKWTEYEALEYRQKDFELGNQGAWKLEDFDLRQQEERDALFQRLNERRKGVWGVIDAISNRLNPVEAAEKAAARQKEIDQLRRRQEIERRDYIKLMDQTRQMELEALRERQVEQQHLREKQYAEDRERYIRERHAAQRILAEQEAKRIQEQLEKAKDKKKGPPPPTMGK